MARKKAELLDISGDMPTTVEFQGKTWKVVDRQIKAHFRCEGEDELKNPKSRFIKTEWLKPNEHIKEIEKLKNEYSKVEMTWAWDITSLFREALNKNSREKDIEEYVLQRQFKNGKWGLINPIDLIDELKKPTESELAPKEKLKQTVKCLKLKIGALWALIVAGIIAIITAAYIGLKK